MKTRMVLFTLVVISACSAASAKSPFDGTWSLDLGKSRLTGVTMSFEDAGNGTLKYTDSTQSYTFRTDGSAFTTPVGDVQTFRKSGDRSYTVITRRNGLLLDTETWALSPDANTLTIESRGTYPNGRTFDDFETDARTSAGTGLVGGWKSTKVKESSPNANVLTIQTAGKDDVTLALSAARATVHGKWDGRDYPYRGPTIPAGATLALSRTGASEFKLVSKLNGRVLQTLHFTVAADGKSMIDESTDGNGKKQPTRQIWDRRT